MIPLRSVSIRSEDDRGSQVCPRKGLRFIVSFFLLFLLACTFPLHYDRHNHQGGRHVLHVALHEAHQDTFTRYSRRVMLYITYCKFVFLLQRNTMCNQVPIFMSEYFVDTYLNPITRPCEVGLNAASNKSVVHRRTIFRIYNYNNYNGVVAHVAIA